jgi:hypothetical protein
MDLRMHTKRNQFLHLRMYTKGNKVFHSQSMYIKGNNVHKR